MIISSTFKLGTGITLNISKGGSNLISWEEPGRRVGQGVRDEPKLVTNNDFRSAACNKENKMASASLEEEDSELNFGKLLVRTFSSSAPPDSKREAQWKVERLNLLNIANLCIKNLIDSALKLGRVISDEYFEPFEQFFVVFESVLRHGLKSKSNICVIMFVVRFLVSFQMTLNKLHSYFLCQRNETTKIILIRVT